MHIVRWKNITDIVGLSKSTVARKIKDGTFPPPIKLSESTVGWPMTDIENWIKEQIKQDLQHRTTEV